MAKHDITIHIAGAPIQVGPRIRQRCAWCAELLNDYDLTRIAVPEGQDPTPAMWPTGELVMVDGNAAWVEPHTDGDQLPNNTCAALEQEAAADARWQTLHQVTITHRLEWKPGDDGWIECRATGLSLVWCTCGYASGWVPNEALPPIEEVYASHPTPTAPADLAARAQTSADACVTAEASAQPDGRTT